MSGLKLKEMEASDMLDVIHVIFEENAQHSSEESAASQSGVRKGLYGLYGVVYDDPYEKGKKKSSPSSPAEYPVDDSDLGIMDEAESAKPFNPMEMKPEQKPALGMDSVTEFDPDAAKPFGNILDAPAG